LTILKGLSTKKTIERRGTMFDLIKKTMLTGVGLVFMTKDRIEELVEELTVRPERRTPSRLGCPKM
jgi:hypothetical protein